MNGEFEDVVMVVTIVEPNLDGKLEDGSDGSRAEVGEGERTNDVSGVANIRRRRDRDWMMETTMNVFRKPMFDCPI